MASSFKTMLDEKCVFDALIYTLEVDFFFHMFIVCFVNYLCELLVHILSWFFYQRMPLLLFIRALTKSNGKILTLFYHLCCRYFPQFFNSHLIAIVVLFPMRRLVILCKQIYQYFPQTSTCKFFTAY